MTQAQRIRLLRARRVKSGRCPECGRHPPRELTKPCLVCSARRKDRGREWALGLRHPDGYALPKPGQGEL